MIRSWPWDSVERDWHQIGSDSNTSSTIYGNVNLSKLLALSNSNIGMIINAYLVELF